MADDDYSHHGDPILTKRDYEICLAMLSWIETARKTYGDAWLPSWVDVTKSRLFWRVRSGKQPLEHPPPRAYACPWYELVEDADRPHWAYELFDCPNGDPLEEDGVDCCYIAQCRYDVVERIDGKPSRVKFGPYTFRVWHGASPNGKHDGWWIQYNGDRS